MKPNKIVSREEWLTVRKTLLEKEKAHMREGDKLAAERRGLPWLKIEKSYTFDTEQGRKTLADLFNGRGQLVVHHLMYAPSGVPAVLVAPFRPSTSTDQLGTSPITT